MYHIIFILGVYTAYGILMCLLVSVLDVSQEEQISDGAAGRDARY